MKYFVSFVSVGAVLLPAVLAQQSAYGQCGGINWTGATTCVSGYTCVYSNDYYSQCVPGTAAASSTKTSSTTKTSSSTKTTSTTKTTSSTKTSSTSTKTSSTTKSSTTSSASSSGSTCVINTYTDASSVSSCSTITINAQTVPAGKSLSITGLKDGTVVNLAGDISFGTGTYWTGNLFDLEGGKITFNGNGHTINGNGQWYWDGQGTNGGVDKPKYTVALKHSGTFQNVIVKNVPGHAFSVKNPAALTITKVTYDNSDGASLGHNTDGFDISSSTDLTITGNTVINQDDCVAINSAKNVVISNNSCTGGHGISIGSIKTGDVVDTVLIQGNTVISNQNGLRIKTYADNDNASVSNVIYKDNTVTGATSYGVIIVQDYTNSGETGTATPGITITNVSFQGTNSVSTTSSATMVKVLCYPGDCTGTWDWSGLKTSGGKKGTNVGGAPITGYTF